MKLAFYEKDTHLMDEEEYLKERERQEAEAAKKAAEEAK